MPIVWGTLTSPVPMHYLDDYMVQKSPYASNNGLTFSTNGVLLGRITAGVGPGEQITIGSGLALSSGGVLSAAGGGGTLTSVGILPANGFWGTVSAGANPLITINPYGNTYSETNTGVGKNALVVVQDYQNTAFGNSAGQYLVVGQSNAFFGSQAGAAIYSGTGNSFFGGQAGLLAGIGSGNTFVGSSSGSAVVTGGGNSILGNYVGTSALSHNVVLSDGSGVVRLQIDSAGSGLMPITVSTAPTATMFDTTLAITAGLEEKITNNWTITGGRAESAGFYSRQTVPYGYGSHPSVSGGGTGGSGFVGLVHDVEIMGDGTDGAAVFHYWQALGATSHNRSDTSAFSYYHNIQTAGTAYSSLFEGEQVVAASGPAYSAYGPALGTSMVGIQSGIRVLDAAPYTNVGTYYFMNVNNTSTANFADGNTWGTGAYRATSFIALGGKWGTLFTGGGTNECNFSVAGIDLFTSVTWGAPTASCTAGTVSGTALTLSGVVTGTFAAGMPIAGAGVASNSYIVSGSGTSFVLNQSSTVSSPVIIQGYTAGIGAPALRISRHSLIDLCGEIPGAYYICTNPTSNQIDIVAGSAYAAHFTSTTANFPGVLTALNFGANVTSYPSSLLAISGGPPTSTLTSFYIKNGKIMFWDLWANITVINGSSGGLVIQLPTITSANGVGSASGSTPTGKLCFATYPISQAYITFTLYDGTTPFAAGTGLYHFSGWYEIT